MMQQAHHRLTVATPGRGFIDMTARVARWLAEVRAGDGLATLFLRHTSASLTILNGRREDDFTANPSSKVVEISNKHFLF